MTKEYKINKIDTQKKSSEWAHHYLSTNGYSLISLTPETVLDSPWSYVARFAVSNGYIYLKQTPKDLALESKIIQILHDQFHLSVAEIIAENQSLNCFLMKDAGKTLRSILKQKLDMDLFCKTINQYTTMQIIVADNVNTFIEIGVPDWRLHKLPDLYMQLLSQKEMLIHDGLLENEIHQLEKLLPRVSSLCRDLSKYSIKQSIVQPDFNDNNTLIDENKQKITMIDLGEIAISHPFFSLLNCLDQAKKHHALSDDEYKKLKHTCFNHYLSYESLENLEDALEKTRTLRLIYGALCNHRLKKACDESHFTPEFQRHGRPSIPLREFINFCS